MQGNSSYLEKITRLSVDGDYGDIFAMIVRGARSTDLCVDAMCRSFREVRLLVHELEPASGASGTLSVPSLGSLRRHGFFGIDHAGHQAFAAIASRGYLSELDTGHKFPGR